MWLGIVLLAGCGGDGRLKVVPAKGKLLLKQNGNLTPMANARMVLYPIEGGDAFPTFPAATTDKDGAFELGTYDENDGAPEGEYIVTIDWRPKKKPKYDLMGQGEVPIGPDRLQGAYSNRKTSKLRATVIAGQELNLIVPSP